MAFFTIDSIRSCAPISRKILGAVWGSICHRSATSIFIPICSRERASICSTSSALSGNCSSRVEKYSTEDHGSTKRIPGRRGRGLTRPKACFTPTFPASITFTIEVAMMSVPRRAASRPPSRKAQAGPPRPWPLARPAAVLRRSRAAPKQIRTRTTLDTAGSGTGEGTGPGARCNIGRPGRPRIGGKRGRRRLEFPRAGTGARVV